jgi:hypothetical protein
MGSELDEPFEQGGPIMRDPNCIKLDRAGSVLWFKNFAGTGKIQDLSADGEPEEACSKVVNY